MYFNEIRVKEPLLTRLVVELKHIGVIPTAPLTALGNSPQNGADDVQDSTPLLSQWVEAGDAILAVGAENCAYNLRDFGDVLQALNIHNTEENKTLFSAIMEW